MSVNCDIVKCCEVAFEGRNGGRLLNVEGGMCTVSFPNITCSFKI